MAVFSVNYDLYLPREYKAFYGVLEAYPHVQVMESCWLVELPAEDAKSVRDMLMRHINANDSLFVTRVSYDWAGAGTQCGQWLNRDERQYA